MNNMITKEDLEKYINWIKGIIPLQMDFENLSSQVQITKLISIIKFIDNFKDHYFDIYDTLTFSTNKNYSIYYYDHVLKVEQTFDVYINSISFDTANVRSEKYLIYKDLNKVYIECQSNYIMIRDAIVIIAATILEKLTEIKYAMDNIELEKNDNYNKDNLIKILLENTTGKYSLDYDIDYLRDLYYKLINAARKEYNRNSITLYFENIINYKLLGKYLFGNLDDRLPTHIYIYLQEDCCNQIEVSNDFGDIIYSIKEIDILTNGCGFENERILLKNIIILLLLKLIGELDK